MGAKQEVGGGNSGLWGRGGGVLPYFGDVLVGVWSLLSAMTAQLVLPSGMYDISFKPYHMIA